VINKAKPVDGHQKWFAKLWNLMTRPLKGVCFACNATEIAYKPQCKYYILYGSHISETTH
jgi:hypothetical protein